MKLVIQVWIGLALFATGSAFAREISSAEQLSPDSKNVICNLLMREYSKALGVHHVGQPQSDSTAILSIMNEMGCLGGSFEPEMGRVSPLPEIQE